MVKRELMRAVARWSWFAKVPTRGRLRSLGMVESCAGKVQLPVAPEIWKAQEVVLKSALPLNAVVVGDDRSSTKLWSVSSTELQANMLASALGDPQWILEPHLGAGALKNLAVAKGMAGLPSWLRSERNAVVNCVPPFVFPLVKSKCFTDSGVHV